MKILLALIAMLLLATAASAQPFVEFTWLQPDSTMGLPPDIPPQATPDGYIQNYEVFKATPTDTLYYGEVSAPYAITDPVFTSVEFEINVPTSIQIRAVDFDGRSGPMSEWSTSLIIEPGPPGEASRPEPVRVHF